MSGLPFLPPELTVLTQFLFQLILILFVWARNQFTKTDSRSLAIMKYITIIMIVEISFTTIVNEIEVFRRNPFFMYFTMNPFVTSLCRPAFIIVQVDSLKNSFARIYYVVIDSVPIIVSMLTTVTAFAFVGERMFLGTLQGTQYFYNFKESWINMFILMTTANFPDIMLPAYHRKRIWCIFFIIYVLL